MKNKKIKENKQTTLDQQQNQKNINARLDKMNFKDTTGSTFDAGAGTHSDKTISFVDRGSGNIELYKGDTKISGEGGKKAIMYLKSPHGGIYDVSGTSEGTISSDTYGNVDAKKISAVYNDLVRIPIVLYDEYKGTTQLGTDYIYFNPKDANGLWAPKGSRLLQKSLGVTTYQTVEGMPSNALDDWNMTTQRRVGFRILRKDDNGNYTNVEYYIYEISVAGIMPTRMGSYQINDTGTSYDDGDWATTKRMIYTVWYKIHMKRYREIRVQYSDQAYVTGGELIEEEDWIPDPVASINYGYHTRIPSQMNNLNFYAPRNYNNAAGYNKDFSDSGIIVAFTQNSLDFGFLNPSDLTAYTTYYNSSTYLHLGYFFNVINDSYTSADLGEVAVIKTFKPHLVLYSEDSVEMYGGGLGNKNGYGRLTYFEEFPGLSTSLTTGETLNDYILAPNSFSAAANFFAYNILSNGVKEV